MSWLPIHGTTIRVRHRRSCASASSYSSGRLKLDIDAQLRALLVQVTALQAQRPSYLVILCCDRSSSARIVSRSNAPVRAASAR